MKPKKSPFFSPFTGCFLLAISSASAQNGTWSGSGGGGATNWTGTAMWSGGIIADGVDNTANFTAINISGARSVGLNEVNRTIGNIVFEDLTNATHDLTIGGVGVALTLDVTSGSPTINVINRTLTTATQAADGITYTIEGSLDLAGFPTIVSVVTTPVITGLPPAGAGYEYRSFSLSGSNGLPGKGFLRAKVTSP